MIAMRRRGHAALLAAAVMCGAILAAIPSAEAQRKKKPDPVEEEKKQQERGHYEKGILHYDLGEFDQAIAEFKQAYAIRGTPALLFNIAQSYRLKKDYEQALHFYKTFLRLRPDAPNRKDVEARIGEMEQVIRDSNRVQEQPPIGTIPPDGTNTGTVPTTTGTTGTPANTTTTGTTTGAAPDPTTTTTGTPPDATMDGGATPTTGVTTVATTGGGGSDTISSTGGTGADTAIATRPRSRLPLSATLRVDAAPLAEDPGALAVIAVGWGVGEHLTVQAGAMIGQEQGVWIGGSASLLSGSIRARFTAGVPIFLTEGVLPGMQIGPGVEWRASPRLSLIFDLTFAHFPTAPDDIVNTMFLPIVGVVGRL